MPITAEVRDLATLLRDGAIRGLKETQLLEGAMLLRRLIESSSYSSMISDLESQCSIGMKIELGRVIKHTLNQHVVSDGILRLWLIPVTIPEFDTLPSVISLASNSTGISLPCAFATANLQKMFGLNNEVEVQGWASIVPQLLSDEAVADLDVRVVCQFPQRTRDAIQNGKPTPLIFDKTLAKVNKGPAVYYLPVVSYHKDKSKVVHPEAHSQLISNLLTWFEACPFLARAKPQPNNVPMLYTEGYVAGRQALLEFELQSTLNDLQASPENIEVFAELEPHELYTNALVLTFTTKGDESDLAQMRIGVRGDDGLEELQMLSVLLHNRGITDISSDIPNAAEVISSVVPVQAQNLGHYHQMSAATIH